VLRYSKTKGLAINFRGVSAVGRLVWQKRTGSSQAKAAVPDETRAALRKASHGRLLDR